MSKYIFSLNTFDNNYKDDLYGTEIINFNQFVKPCKSEFGIGRDFNELNARGELNLSFNLTFTNKYFFSILVNKQLNLAPTDLYNVAISISNDFAILAFNSDGYIGYIYNDVFEKITSSNFPNGFSIFNSFHPDRENVHIMVSCNGSEIAYYIDGTLIGYKSPIITLNTTNPICYFGNFIDSSKDGRLGRIDEIIFYPDFIEQQDCEHIYASFERLIPYETDMVEVKFYYSGNGTSENSIGGPITNHSITEYDELNVFLPEILRKDNFYGRPIYKILYLKNDSNKTIFEPRLTIMNDFNNIHIGISVINKNEEAVTLNDKYDSGNALNGYLFQLPNEILLTEFLNPQEYVGIIIKHFTHNYSLPNSLIMKNINVGDNYCFLKYGEADLFNIGEFVIIYNMHSDVDYDYEIKQIKNVDIYQDSLTFTNSFSNSFQLGSNVSKLYRSSLFVKYGV